MNQVNANERQDTLTEDQAKDLRTQAEDNGNMLGCYDNNSSRGRAG
jgi:hypothetical protein